MVKVSQRDLAEAGCSQTETRWFCDNLANGGGARNRTWEVSLEDTRVLLGVVQKATPLGVVDAIRKSLPGFETGLRGVDIHSLGMDLRGSCLRGLDLSGANLSGCDLSGADLSGIILVKAFLNETDLTEANLTGADLSEVSLCHSTLIRTNLARARLVRANLTGAILIGTNLQGVDMSGAFMSLGVGGPTLAFPTQT